MNSEMAYCLSRNRRDGRESRTRFKFPDHLDRVPQIAGDRVVDSPVD